jgi:hypothetical protein
MKLNEGENSQKDGKLLKITEMTENDGKMTKKDGKGRKRTENDGK